VGALVFQTSPDLVSISHENIIVACSKVGQSLKAVKPGITEARTRREIALTKKFCGVRSARVQIIDHCHRVPLCPPVESFLHKTSALSLLTKQLLWHACMLISPAQLVVIGAGRSLSLEWKHRDSS